ncbi:MAG: hypothetical protein V4692_06690, partial [Bdellovibrionota bacterium]
MKCFTQIALVVIASVALGSTSLAKTSARSKKTSQSKTVKTSSKKTSKKFNVDDIELDLDESDAPTRKTASFDTAAVDPLAAELLAAEAEEKSGHPDKGVAILKPHAEKLQRSGLILLARLYGKTGNSAAQIGTLEISLSKNPKDYVLQTLMGDALSKTDRIDDAVTAYNESRKLNKMYRPAYDGLLALFEKKAEHYESLTLVSDMVKLFPKVGSYHSVLCKLYSQGDYLAKANEICANAMKKDSKNPENYIQMAITLRDQEKLKEASSLMDKA